MRASAISRAFASREAKTEGRAICGALGLAATAATGAEDEAVKGAIACALTGAATAFSGATEICGVNSIVLSGEVASETAEAKVRRCLAMGGVAIANFDVEVTKRAFSGALHEATGALRVGAGVAAALAGLVLETTVGVNKVCPIVVGRLAAVGRLAVGAAFNLTDVNAGKLWRGAIVVAGLAVLVSDPSPEAAGALFSCALAGVINVQGAAKKAGTNRTSKGLEADMAE